jgi:hypothetical protein
MNRSGSGDGGAYYIGGSGSSVGSFRSGNGGGGGY